MDSKVQMTNQALLVENVGKTYFRRGLFGRRRGGASQSAPALQDVSFTVRQGETIGLLGPNGAGKTTLLKIIATLLYPGTGRVLLHGHDVLEDPVTARGMMGLVTCDERSFYWRLTGRQNLSFFGTLYGLSKRQTAERSEPLLETLGLSSAADRPYHTYSSGMKQKLAIARGLLAEPRLVLYDEPTRSLDPLSTQNIRNWIARKRVESPHQTHLIATNQLDEAEQLCDRVLIINRGKLIAHGTISEIRERWHAREYEVHQVTWRGVPLNGWLQADPEIGLFDVEQMAVEGPELSARLRIGRGSPALSHVLQRILDADGRIVSCQMEQVPFDEVFCSLVLGDSAEAAALQEVTQ